jgi:hypothetical protein
MEIGNDEPESEQAKIHSMNVESPGFVPVIPEICVSE